MGFISTRWLKGDPERNRRHYPVKGEVSGRPSRTDWSKRNNVVFRINVERPDGDYKSVYLTQDEVGELLPEMVKVGEQSTRINVALAILTRLPNAELLQFLTRLLSEREKGGERDDRDWLE
jgi:hypothetical protein